MIRVQGVAPNERSDCMLLFILCFVGGFIIARKIQDYRIQKMTDRIVQLEHQKKILQTGNPFWAIFPDANRENHNDEMNET